MEENWRKAEFPEQADEMSAKMEEYPHLRLRGFMTIPPISVENGGNLRYFAKMYQLYVDIKAKNYDNTNMRLPVSGHE